MPRSCRANIPRAGSSSGWDRTRIWSPIRSRARARSTSSPWCREPGTGRAGARPARPTKSRRLFLALARDRADADRRRRLAEMGAVHGARWRRMDRWRDRAAGRRRACDAAVRRARRRHGDRGCGGAGQMFERKRRRKHCRHSGRPEALWTAAARPRAKGFSARHGSRGGSIISPARWRWRATSPSGRWAPKRMLARQDWIYDWRA